MIGQEAAGQDVAKWPNTLDRVTSVGTAAGFLWGATIAVPIVWAEYPFIAGMVALGMGRTVITHLLFAIRGNRCKCGKDDF
tara:strand:+ start:2079 stop:2321 length:243 start_codon:yes stop_codon:yes gene_type:complete